MPAERLQKVLAAAGVASRRSSEDLIAQGRVTVDGRVARVGDQADPERSVIAVDGRVIGAAAQNAYLLLHKPPGYVTTLSDERGRRAVMDLVPAALRAPGLHPVGRLDRDTSGLLLLTNDGNLTQRLTHPKHEVEKEYWLALREPPTEAQLAAVRRGVMLDGRPRRPLRLERLREAAPFELSITIAEGRKRQVRRMCEAVGHPVITLERIAFGPLKLGGLKPGAHRRLSAAEVAALRRK